MAIGIERQNVIADEILDLTQRPPQDVLRSFESFKDLIERHPEGSQAFLPMTQHRFLVIVAADCATKPRAFLTNGAQGINLHRGTWHGVLTPLHTPGLFAVVDRIGASPNLEEYHYPQPWTVLA